MSAGAGVVSCTISSCDNIAIGCGAMCHSTSCMGAGNIAIGKASLRCVTGKCNLSIGHNAVSLSY